MPCPRRSRTIFRSRGASRLRGFTLIEVLIAMVVLAILAAAAYPLYTDYVRRSRIMEATSTMNDYRVRMEQYFQDNRTYANAGSCGVPNPVTNGSFTYNCDNASATGYQLDATGVATQGMSGFHYRLLIDGGALTRSTEGLYSGWTMPTGNCWAVRKNGDCT